MLMFNIYSLRQSCQSRHQHILGQFLQSRQTRSIRLLLVGGKVPALFLEDQPNDVLKACGPILPFQKNLIVPVQPLPLRQRLAGQTAEHSHHIVGLRALVESIFKVPFPEQLVQFGKVQLIRRSGKSAAYLSIGLAETGSHAGQHDAERRNSDCL